MKRIVICFLWLVFGTSSAFAQTFVEQAAAIGIDHTYKARDLTGGGAAFFDYDNDGDEDLYITGGYDKDNFYVNNGDGTFTKSLNDMGFNITQTFNTMAVTTGDIDNDGDRDIMVTTWEKFDGVNQPMGRNLLFLNDGNGSFTEIGEQAGIVHTAFSMAASFLDYDRDGYLDIYVMNHIESPAFTFDSTGTIDGYAHTCFHNFFYKNNGDLTFTEVAADMAVDNNGCTIAALGTDYDMDGDLDIYMANDFGGFIVPNTMYENNYPNDEFQEVDASLGANVQAFGMGIAAGDYDQDGDFDYYTTNIGRNILIDNNNGQFEDVTTFAGVENTNTPDGQFTTSWGTAFLDVDNDALLDLYVANGRIPAIPSFATGESDPDKLFLNNGDKTFTDVSDDAGVSDMFYGRGMAYSDFDQDGDLDIIVIVLNELGGRTKFYVNETMNDHNYIQFQLEGKLTNRDAYGSKLWMYAGGQECVREIIGGGASYSSQHSSTIHFGLKDMTQVDSVRIEWLSGHVDHIAGPLAINQVHKFVENVEVTSTEDLAFGDDNQLSLSPNPFQTQVELSFDQALNSNARLKVLSLDGKVLLDQLVPAYTTHHRIDFPAAMPAGIYQLQIQQGDTMTSRKLVKM